MPRLWLDSTVARIPRQIEDLSDLATPRGIKIVVSAHIYLEQYRRERTRSGERFSIEIFNGFLKRLGLEVMEISLTRQLAERWGERLYKSYPTNDLWQGAKRKSVKAKLPDGAINERHRIPMTADWLVALQVEDDAEGYVVTDDKGPEWDALRKEGRAKKLEEVKSWLEGFPRRL